MGFLLKLKAGAWALGAAALAFAGLFIKLKFVEHQRDKANARAVVAEAERDQVKSNTGIAKLTRTERSAQRKKAINKIAEGGVPATLGDDLNKW